jgi:hypothetical protein
VSRRPGPVSRHPVLTAAALNRATLARQRLLERDALDPVATAGEVAGLQAQEPASPYLGLLARVAGLEAAAVDRAFRERRLVKATLMRATLHALPAAEYRRLQPAVGPVLAAMSRREVAARPDERHLHRLRRAVLDHAAEPRTNAELRDHVAELHPTDTPEDLWWWVRRHVALVHAPTRAPWSFGRRPALVDADAWLAGEAGFVPEATALEHLARRYLGAFGPATSADAAAWSGLQVGRLRPAIEALDAAGELVRFADPRGRELLDLAAAPRPDPETPAPPRILPMWDSVVLAHADRTRIVSDADRARVVAVNGDTYPTFLVDGRVAGLWWAVVDGGGRVRLDLEPFRPLPVAHRRALEAEAERVAAFVAPVEPRVYARYRASRDRRAGGTFGRGA